LAACVAVALSQPAPAVVAVSNFGRGYNFDLPGLVPLATSFTTGDSPSTLNSATVMVGQASEGPKTFTFAVWSDNAGLPGAPLESYPGQAFGSGLTKTMTFTSTGYPLDANTTYWGVAGTPDIGILSLDVTFLPEPSSLALATLSALTLLHRGRRAPRPE
jgi:hypothetical protein